MTKLGSFAQTVFETKYAQTKEDGTLESWDDVAHRVASAITGEVFPGEVEIVEELIRERKFLPGGRYLYAAGRPYLAINNCVLFRAEDSREGWAKLMHDAVHALMSGAGIGVDYTAIRPRGANVRGLGGICTGPIALMEAVNETARQIQAGGSRRSAVYASLAWYHPDALEFAHLKDWDERTVDAKAADFNARAPMDMTNISVQLDDNFFAIMDGRMDHATYNVGGVDYRADRAHAERVYSTVVHQMLTTGEPGFQVDVGENAGETLRNACTESVSRDHFDVCNLGSLNMGAHRDIDDWMRTIFYATRFLYAGTVVGELPNDEAREVRDRNRRLGLGLMGVYDWLVGRGHSYDPNPELGEWLSRYRDASDFAAKSAAYELDLPVPIAVRAVAPAGTISIIAECSSGIEPLFATAYRRRYLKDGATWHYQYVVDQGAKRLVETHGVDPGSLETAYELAYTPERRIAFQAFVQQYVDQGISSTLNLPSPGEHAVDPHQFGAMLYKHLPELRGITVYPNGSRAGQPLQVVNYDEAVRYEGVEYEEFSAENGCKGGVCGI